MPISNIFGSNSSRLFLVKVLIGREFSGPQPRKFIIPSQLYTNLQLLRRTLGHLSAVYCVLFDRTGRYIVTVSLNFLNLFYFVFVWIYLFWRRRLKSHTKFGNYFLFIEIMLKKVVCNDACMLKLLFYITHDSSNQIKMMKERF